MKGIRRAISKGFRLLLAAWLGFSASAALAERVEDLPQPTDYVSDYAHVLSADTVARLDRLCAQLDHSQANSQLAIVTVSTMDGDDAADYANRLEDKWKMGKKGSDRGVLFLLAVNYHKYRIDVGYGLEGILPDGKVGDIGRDMVPDLRAGDYDGAVSMVVGELAQVIATDAKVTLTDDEPAPVVREPVRHNGGTGLAKLILILILLIVFGGFNLLRFLFAFGLFGGGWGRGPFIGGGGFGGGGFSGGGGGGGGGGGFGGFGGGSFGGGGAGGSW
jgi:uncharacterized protein